MQTNKGVTNRCGFTLIELLAVILILGVLTAVALPTYVNTVMTADQGTANANARAIATALQTKAISTGAYDTNLADYATDLGGVLPTNPCTGTTTGYTISVSGMSATIAANPGSNCGSWTPKSFSVTR